MTSQNESGLPDEPEPPVDAEPEPHLDAEQQAARDRAVFDELVASFHTVTAPDPVPRWPVAEDAAPEDADAESSDPAEAGDVPPAPPRKLTRVQRDLIYRDFSIVEPTDETTVDKYFPDEHFEPPEPPPMPEASGATKAAWTAFVGGLLFLLLRTLLQWDTDPWMFWVAVSASVGGFIALVAGIRPDRDDYDDPDNGAVV